jgi:hypothetical protein
VPQTQAKQPQYFTTPSGLVIDPATGSVVGGSQNNQPVQSSALPTPQTQDLSANTGGVTLGDNTGNSGAAFNYSASAGGPALPSIGGGTTSYDPRITSSAAEDAYKKYQDSLTMSPEEIDAQTKLNALNASAAQAYSNTEGQAIPLEFITGQKAALQRSQAALSVPLESQLSLAQAKRQMAMTSSKAALEREQAKVDASREVSKPISLASGASLVDPKTGKVISTNTAKIDTESNPDRLLTITEAKTLGVPFGTTAAQAFGVTPGKSVGQSDTSKSISSVIDQLLATDTKAISGIPSITSFIPGTDAQKTKNLYNQLKGMLSLENRTQLKGSGAISDFEAKILEKAASSLGTNLSDKDFVETLNQLKKDLSSNDTSTTNLEPDEVQYLKTKGYSDAQIQAYQASFSKVGNTTASTVSIPKSSRLASVNNNPGNLRFANQTGATLGEGGFAKFSTPEDGAKALENQIKLDASRNLTLSQFVSKYAPPSENDTVAYLNYLISATGAEAGTPISQISTSTLVRAVAKKESNTKIT